MSDWVCKTCGTINIDVLDMRNTPMEMYLSKMARAEREMERRRVYEEKGEIPPIFCETCGEERIQGRVR